MAKITPTEAEQSRLQRAQAALGDYAVACATAEDGSRCFVVTKLSDLTSYRVTSDHRCTCPDSVQRESTRCKHFWMVVLTTQRQNFTPAEQPQAATHGPRPWGGPAEAWISPAGPPPAWIPPTPGGSAPAPSTDMAERRARAAAAVRQMYDAGPAARLFPGA